MIDALTSVVEDVHSQAVTRIDCIHLPSLVWVTMAWDELVWIGSSGRIKQVYSQKAVRSLARACSPISRVQAALF